METGDFFKVAHTGTDKSYLEDVFICTGVDDDLVVGLMITRKTNYGNQVFRYGNWDVTPVKRSTVGIILMENKSDY